MFARWCQEPLRAKLRRPYVHLVFGARQTGKSTLLSRLLPPDALRIDLSVPATRASYLRDPDQLLAQCRSLPRRGKPYVFIDEAQAVPALFDAVQHLYDSDKGRWRFVLCGSSARRLRRSGANLLPGRSFLHRLYPLTTSERPPDPAPAPHAPSPLPFPWPRGRQPARRFPAVDLETRLAFGDLPGIATAPEGARDELLRAYAAVHLEEEIRREATIKDVPAFLRFLRLAALESGQMLNCQAISRDAGVSQPAVKAHYQLLDDMFVGFLVPAFAHSARRRVLSTPRFFMFDLGLRHAAAALRATRDTVRANPGPLFEQLVGIELWKRLQYLGTGQLYYQRTKDGAEVDFIVEVPTGLYPVEVKWTEHPTSSDARHLLTFLREHPQRARRGFVVCRCPLPMQLHEQVTAIPWSCL
ncbi:MAG: ATP-binding protein [Deltaproteobacteria bacterium]|nr:ATP-binding protein [Deltaproteobacteria bacterium]